MREIAIRNREASGATGPLPAALTAPPPEKPLPYEDDDMGDLSVDLTANGFDPSESFNMDKSLADDIVPVADPGIEKAVTVSRFILASAYIQPTKALDIGTGAGSPSSSPSPHVRRKSVLPLDPQVMRDLQAHKSLEAQPALEREA